MTGLELAILAGAGQALLKGGLSAAGQFGAAQDLKLTPEQQKRLRELERMQARNALGMTQGERELYRSQAMTPVQAAEREAMARFGAAQNIADIGQGAAFRQQQALADTGQAARAQVSQAVAQRDADVAQQQAEEKARLEEQQRQAKALERQAALSVVGGIGEAAVGAAGVSAEYGMAKELYGKQIDELRGSAKATSQGTQNMLGIQAVEGARKPILGADGVTAVEGMEAPFNPLQGFEYVPPEVEEQIISLAEEQQVPPNLLQEFIRNEKLKYHRSKRDMTNYLNQVIDPVLAPLEQLYWHQRRKMEK
jgi:hypothetical protein